jgi:hypothetical protein
MNEQDADTLTAYSGWHDMTYPALPPRYTPASVTTLHGTKFNATIDDDYLYVWKPNQPGVPVEVFPLGALKLCREIR